MNDMLISHTTEIVAAFVTNNSMAAADVPSLIANVHTALNTIGNPPAIKAPAPEPVVPVRKSYADDHVTCLICGAKQQMLKRHLSVSHNLTADEYREMFKLERGHPLTAPAYARRRRDIAVEGGLGRKLKANTPTPHVAPTAKRGR